MSNVSKIVQCLLEDDPPVNEQPAQPAPEGEEDIRDLFLRLSRAPEPFHAKGNAIRTGKYDAVSAGLGNRRSRKVANNTYLERKGDGSISLRLHDTDVVNFRPDGSVAVDTGGWFTNTTRARINDVLPGGWQLYSESFKKHGEEAPDLYWGDAQIKRVGKFFWFNRETNAGTGDSGWYIPYTDGDTIQPDGTLQHQAQPKQRGQNRGGRRWP